MKFGMKKQILSFKQRIFTLPLDRAKKQKETTLEKSFTKFTPADQLHLTKHKFWHQHSDFIAFTYFELPCALLLGHSVNIVKIKLSFASHNFTFRQVDGV